MGWLQILKLVPLVLRLVQTAEQMFQGRGEGAKKKKLVVSALESVVGGMETFGGLGGASKAEVVDVLGGIVDEAVVLGNEFESIKPGP